MDEVAARLAHVRLPAPRPHQQGALAAFAAHRDRERFHFVMPPGSGKTLLGSLIGQKVGRPILVLVPNTAIQGQWLALWEAAGAQVGSDRDLAADVTVLTYQALATFDDEAQGAASARLHPNARATIARLRARPFTLILDEAHHLAAVWGQVLVDVLDEASAVTVALTATPRQALNAAEAAQVEELFGPVLYAVSTPALVRDAVLAPYRELPWFVTPTPGEQEYLTRSAQRWQELLTAVMEPEFGPTGLLPYVDVAWVRHDQVSWSYIEKHHGDLARAVLRMCHNGLCSLPDGARVRDEHRVPMQVEDWVAVLSDYGRRVLAEPEQPGWERLRAGLRSVGWTLTIRGARKGQSALDRVLSRTAAKAVAAGFLVGQEALIRGDDLRAIVLTDFENAQAAPPADIRSVLAATAGSAWEALAGVQAANTELRVVLMTGAAVGGLPQVLASLAAPGLEVEERADGWAQLVGTWGPREWVPHVTAAFQSGDVDVLVGTRGLLGEGWDAPAANVLIDLTAATTSTAVVQVRGRAIRRDPVRPDKVAHIWSVTAVADEHPRGDLDYRRLVAKHRGYLAPDVGGAVVAGVEHLDARCGPYAPPQPPVRDAINASALDTAAHLADTRAAWQVGQPYRDVVETAVRVRAPRALGVPEVAVRRWAGLPVSASVATSGVAATVALAGQSPTPTVAIAALGGAGLGWLGSLGWQQWRVRRTQARMGVDGMLLAFGCTVAESLQPGGADSVDVMPDAEGQWRLVWHGPDRQGVFAEAVEQLLSPVDFPRYLVSRRLGARRAVMWHAVPDVFGANKAAAQAFLTQWQRYVSRGQVLYTGSAEGAGVAEAVRGANPLDVSSALYAEWV